MALESLHGVERYQHKWNEVQEEAMLPEIGNFTNQYQLMMPPLPKVRFLLLLSYCLDKL